MALAAATNKHEVDHRYPRFAVLFTNYSPEREQPLKTELRVASFVQNLDALADDWLAANIKRGWVAASSFRRPEEDAVEDRGHATPTSILEEREPIAAAVSNDPTVAEPPANPGPLLKITFARSSSPTFPLVRRRLDALAPLGSLAVTKDEKGREACLELTLAHGLVENARRIASLLAIVQRWKTTEVALDGDVLARPQLARFLAKLEHVRLCWLPAFRFPPRAGPGTRDWAPRPCTRTDCTAPWSLRSECAWMHVSAHAARAVAGVLVSAP